MSRFANRERRTVPPTTSGMAKMIGLKNALGRRALFALAVSCTACAASSTFAATPRATPPRFDGMWSVLIVTETGDCDRGYRYPIRISGSQLVNAGSAGFTITGKVSPQGAIQVLVSHGSAHASGSGQLSVATGIGRWSGGSCSGTWTAERRAS